MISSWFIAPISSLLLTILKTIGIYFAVILFTRLHGVRAFAKISGFDFAMTVAVGSAIATTMISPSPPLLQAAVALGSLFALQKIVARLRLAAAIEPLIDNQPILIVDDGEILWDALDKVDLTERDLRAKLRQSDVVTLDNVRAVVAETTGDMSIIEHKDDRDAEFDHWMLEDVRRAGEIASHDPEAGSEVQPTGG